MTLTPASISISSHGDATCIQLVGEIVVEEQIVDEIGAAATAVIDGSDAPKLVVSFKDVSYVASAVIGTMISISHRLAGKGTRLHLCDVNEHIRGVCEVTRIMELFDFCETLADALESLSAPVDTAE